MNKAVTQKIDKYDLDSCKKWLCDTTPINVKKGLGNILSLNSLFKRLYQGQISHLRGRLMEDILGRSGLLQQGSSSETENDMQLSGDRFTVADGIVAVDDVITIETNYIDSIIPYDYIRSRPKFIKLMYQYISCFPAALFEAYTEVTGESLILDDLSVVREFYKSCSAFDSWTGHELCAYISHCDPKALNFISENPKVPLPTRFFNIFPRADLYEESITLVKAAILGGAFELLHLDRDNWAQSTLKPMHGLEWAKTKGMGYHPILDEYLLTLDITSTPVISSGYTTPYLEMMLEVIRELGISRENQVKKEAVAASFAKKLIDHKLTPPSQKLADAMATLVRLPESQQGRAKHKG